MSIEKLHLYGRININACSSIWKTHNDNQSTQRSCTDPIEFCKCRLQSERFQYPTKNHHNYLQNHITSISTSRLSNYQISTSIL